MARHRRRRPDEELEPSERALAVRPSLRSEESEETADRLLGSESADPSVVANNLGRADHATQARALQTLQRERGNSYVESVIRGIAVQQAGLQSATRGGMGEGVGRGETLTLERELAPEEEEIPEAPIAEEAADLAPGSVEAVGPTTNSSYGLAAVSLSDVASQISTRDEAGQCGWAESWDYKALGGRITAVSVTVTINIEMPAWTPPPSMLPKAKAEWERWYGALLAHEQGHVQLIHDHFDGLAAKILGKSPTKGKAMFDGAKADLAAASKAYDARTGHGKKAGTIIDTSIEDKEIEDKKKEDEEKRKKEAEKGEKKAEVEGPAPAPEAPAAG
jgi:hypothetical protein